MLSPSIHYHPPFTMKPHLQTQLPVCLTLISMVILLSSSPLSSTSIARAGCQDICGSVSIPFPWGIGPHCFLDPWYEINCTSTKPLLSKFGAEVVEIDVLGSDDSTTIVSPHITVRLPPLNICSVSDTNRQQLSSIDLRGGPYVYSVRDNVLVMEGCAGSTVLVDQSNGTMSGCATICNSNNSTAVIANDCYGVECCQSPLTNHPPSDPFTSYSIDFNPQSSGGGGQNCIQATLVKSDSVSQYVGRLSSSNPSGGAAPVSLTWSWTSHLQPDVDPHATCSFDDSTNTTQCSCNQDSVGSNPYVSGGCQVAGECKECLGHCYKTNGSYKCVQPVTLIVAVFGVMVGIALVILTIGCYGLYRLIRRRRRMKKTAKMFKRNGGLLLEKQLSSNAGVIERSKIFTSKELEKATDNFHENRILGQGGQGTVYKGMLPDGRIVAIKKSKLVDESQLEQFINEVVVLSQINHRNVVKLLGCCLETEVPLLVYEFISSGTLFQHIHEPDEDFVMSWATRLKVATESAGAIAYLHSSSSTPIYHRDIKSSNILLDDKKRAKVSDFGSSKTIAIDQTHLTTIVQGTMGYLDPEYFQSYQFTEKSDVYSFGVVLLELLTGRKPIYRAENMEQKNLVPEFILAVENSKLYDILDPVIVKEAKEEEVMVAAELAKRCLNWTGRMRPTMKEVAMTLDMIIRSPDEMSSLDNQASPDEIALPKIADSEFISDPFNSGSSYFPVFTA